MHGLEIPFVFGTYANKGVRGFAGTGPEADRLSGLMMDAWIGFMRDGSASHSELSWTSYTPERRSTAVFDAETAVVDAPFDEERTAWDGIIS